MMQPSSSPRISVVVPAYNCERTIGRALRSALEQRPAPDEIVVVDDGSTDATAATAEACGPRVRVIRQSNAGAPAARNRGIAETTGHLIAFLDADDEWLPGRLERGAAPFADAPDMGLTWCRLWRVFPDGAREIYGRHFDRYLIFPRRFWPPAMQQTSGTMVRREAIARVGGFDEGLRTREDQDLWIRIAEAYRTVEVPEPLAIYHETEASLSKTAGFERMRKDYFSIIERGFARRPDLYEPHRRTILAEAHWHWGLKYLAAGHKPRARGELARSLRFSPRARVLAAWAVSFFPSGWIEAARRRARRRARNA